MSGSEEEIGDDEMRRGLKESYHEHGEVRCTGCNDRAIDLSDADDLEGAVEIWNKHVRQEHQ